MTIPSTLAWLFVLCAPLRAAQAPVHPIGEIKTALGSGPTRHAAKKICAYEAGGGRVSVESVGSRFAEANRKADRAIAAYAMSEDYKTRQGLVSGAVKVLEDDYFFVSHGRQKTLEDIARDRNAKVSARHQRRIKMKTAALMEKARQEAEKLRAEILSERKVSDPNDEFYGTQD